MRSSSSKSRSAGRGRRRLSVGYSGDSKVTQRKNTYFETTPRKQPTFAPLNTTVEKGGKQHRSRKARTRSHKSRRSQSRSCKRRRRRSPEKWVSASQVCRSKSRSGSRSQKQRRKARQSKKSQRRANNLKRIEIDFLVQDKQILESELIQMQKKYKNLKSLLRQKIEFYKHKIKTQDSRLRKAEQELEKARAEIEFLKMEISIIGENQNKSMKNITVQSSQNSSRRGIRNPKNTLNTTNFVDKSEIEEIKKLHADQINELKRKLDEAQSSFRKEKASMEIKLRDFLSKVKNSDQSSLSKIIDKWDYERSKRLLSSGGSHRNPQNGLFGSEKATPQFDFLDKFNSYKEAKKSFGKTLSNPKLVGDATFSQKMESKESSTELNYEPFRKNSLNSETNQAKKHHQNLKQVLTKPRTTAADTKFSNSQKKKRPRASEPLFTTGQDVTQKGASAPKKGIEKVMEKMLNEHKNMKKVNLNFEKKLIKIEEMITYLASQATNTALETQYQPEIPGNHISKKLSPVRQFLETEAEQAHKKSLSPVTNDELNEYKVQFGGPHQRLSTIKDLEEMIVTGLQNNASVLIQDNSSRAQSQEVAQSQSTQQSETVNLSSYMNQIRGGETTMIELDDRELRLLGTAGSQLQNLGSMTCPDQFYSLSHRKEEDGRLAIIQGRDREGSVPTLELTAKSSAGLNFSGKYKDIIEDINKMKCEIAQLNRENIDLLDFIDKGEVELGGMNQGKRGGGRI